MKLIGLAGVAKAGKDTFFQALRRAYPQYKFARLSLGDQIRHDLADFCIDTTGINIFNPTSEEKEFIRPLMAWYGDAKRKLTKGRYFIDKVQVKIDSGYYSHADYGVVTDIRFKEFEWDEPEWIKKEGGILIHIQRQLPDGSYTQPANDLERLNDPKLRNCADMTMSWPTLINTDNILDPLANVIRRLDPLSSDSSQKHHTESQNSE